MTLDFGLDPKKMLAAAAFTAAVAFSIFGLLIQPPGELSDSNLYLIAQFLLLTCSMMGIDINTSKNNKT